MHFKKKYLYFSIPAILIILGLIFTFSNFRVVEQVKKQTAKITKQEYIPNQKIDLTHCIVTQQKDSIYQDFRNKCKYHFQTIGVATFPDSSRMILISEPPPYFVKDSLQSILKKFTHQVDVRKHKMGYDGFAIDLIISLANATQENVDHLAQMLSKQLYLSDYKSFVTKLPLENKRKYFTTANIDYQISLFEFNEWFLEQNEKFFSMQDTTHTFSAEEMFKSRKYGVFFSQLPGFVAWCLPKRADLQAHIGDIRQFTLDSDLILGALADSNSLIIIGREREAPLYELPPLYVESILLLASISEKELSQSLDVNDFLAGKMKNGHDWCPTYLSKELENTEFGHLMTITDILLKDWSERGTIEEYNYRYPTPGYYPFDRPLFKKLGIEELVYNWNTANAMYAIDINNVTIYTLNRTGSLPVSYFNSPETGQSIGWEYEQRAYSYFATCGNTDLARVVQYTALYQLFTDNGITYSGDIHTAFPKNKPFLLLQPTQNLLTIFKNLSDKEIDYLCDSITARNYRLFQAEKIEEELAKNEHKYNYEYTSEHREKIHSTVREASYKDLKSDFRNVRSLLQQLSPDDFKKVSKQLAYPRGQRINSRESYNIMLKGKRVRDLLNKMGKKNLDLLHLDLGDVKNWFVNQLGNSSAPYLKTPSIIVTFNDFMTTGGHNISSKISRVNSLKNYKRSNTHSYDYTQERNTRDHSANAPTGDPPQSNPKSNSAPSGKSTPSKSGSGTTTTARVNNTPARTSTAHPATRSRSSVIPTTTRKSRGF